MNRVPLVLTVSLMSLRALSQESQQPVGSYEHDGLFLSLSTGSVHVAMHDNLGSVELDAGGWGLGFDLRVGGTIAPQLIVSGDLMTMTWGLPAPLPGESQFDGGTLCQCTWGVGLTYYFMPANIFVSGTVGLATLSSVKLDDSSGEPSANGLAIIIKAGKEWWVCPEWALGIAASFGWSSVQESSESRTDKLAGYSIGVQFNATLN